MAKPIKVPQGQVLHVTNDDVVNAMDESLDGIVKSFGAFKTAMKATIAYLLAREIEHSIHEETTQAINDTQGKVEALATLAKHHDKQLSAIEHKLKDQPTPQQLTIPTDLETIITNAFQPHLERLAQRISNIEDAITTPPETNTLPAGRIRASATARIPRAEAEQRVRTLWGDGGWHTPDAMARKHGTSAATIRYLRGNFSTICRDMHRDGTMDRKDSNTRGSMYTYRLTQAKTHNEAT